MERTEDISQASLSSHHAGATNKGEWNGNQETREPGKVQLEAGLPGIEQGTEGLVKRLKNQTRQAAQD